MQLTTLFTVCVAALASTAAAMPHLSGAYHGARIAVRVPGNATSHNATATGKAPLSTGSSHKDRVNVNRCHELCSLQSQACSIAVPDDDKFW